MRPRNPGTTRGTASEDEASKSVTFAVLQVISFAASMGIMALFIGAVSVEEYGAVNFVASVYRVWLVACLFNLDATVVYFFPKHGGRGRRELILFSSRVLLFSSIGLISVLVLVDIVLFPWMGLPLLAVSIAGFSGEVAQKFLFGCMIAAKWLKGTAILQAMKEVLFGTLALVNVVVLGLDVVMAYFLSMLVSNVIINAAIVVAILFNLKRGRKEEKEGDAVDEKPLVDRRAVVTYSAYIFLSTILGLLIFSIDRILVYVMLGPFLGGVIFFYFLPIDYMDKFFRSIVKGILPFFSTYHHSPRKEGGDSASIFTKFFKLVLLLFTFLVLAIGFLGRGLVSLLFVEYAPYSWLLVGLVTKVLTQAFSTNFATVMEGHGMQRQLLFCKAVSFSGFAIASLVLLHVAGLPGILAAQAWPVAVLFLYAYFIKKHVNDFKALRRPEITFLGSTAAVAGILMGAAMLIDTRLFDLIALFTGLVFALVSLKYSGFFDRFDVKLYGVVAKEITKNDRVAALVERVASLFTKREKD